MIQFIQSGWKAGGWGLGSWPCCPGSLEPESLISRLRSKACQLPSVAPFRLFPWSSVAVFFSYMWPRSKPGRLQGKQASFFSKGNRGCDGGWILKYLMVLLVWFCDTHILIILKYKEQDFICYHLYPRALIIPKYLLMHLFFQVPKTLSVVKQILRQQKYRNLHLFLCDVVSFIASLNYINHKAPLLIEPNRRLFRQWVDMTINIQFYNVSVGWVGGGWGYNLNPFISWEQQTLLVKSNRHLEKQPSVLGLKGKSWSIVLRTEYSNVMVWTVPSGNEDYEKVSRLCMQVITSQIINNLDIAKIFLPVVL